MSADPENSSPAPITPPPTDALGTTGLPLNVAAALSVMIPLVGGIVFLFLERKDRFVRFYCIQSIVLGVLLGAAWLMLSMVEFMFQPIWFVGSILVKVAQIVYFVFALAWLIVYFCALYKAFSGKIWAIPYLGPMAKKYITPHVP